MGTPPNPNPQNPTGGDQGTPPPTNQVSNDSLQNAISAIEQVGVAAASPFIHSPSGQATESKVVAEVNLGIAALPLLESLYNAISHLFHHAKASAEKQAVQSVATVTNEGKS